MRCLQKSDHKGHPDRAQPGNLLEKLAGGMLPAFRQHLRARFLTYPHQKIELFIEPLSTTTYARFPQFFQPDGALARGIDLLTSAGNRPAPIQPFEPIHHASEV